MVQSKKSSKIIKSGGCFMQNRSVATVIILTIVTCGIYALYWVYTTAAALEEEGRTGGLSAGVQLVLTLFFGSVGYALFGYYADNNLNAIRARRGMPASDNKVLYIILGIFLPIVLIGIVQNDINKLTENKMYY